MNTHRAACRPVMCANPAHVRGAAGNLRRVSGPVPATLLSSFSIGCLYAIGAAVDSDPRHLFASQVCLASCP